MINRRIVALCIGAMVAVTALSGCSVKSDTPVVGKLLGLDSDEIFKVDELICKTPEVKLTIMNKANKYKTDLGDVTWDMKMGDSTLKDIVKEDTKNDLSIVYTMSALADSKNMVLSDLEITSIKEAAKQYYDTMTDEEKEYTQATEETVVSLYTNYYKANKVYDYITADANTEISDEDARVMEIQYIFIDTSKTKVEKAQSNLEDVIGLVNGGYQTFAREAKQYSDNDIIEMTLKKNEASKDFEKAAFNLSNGDMSEIITQDDGLYLVYCKNSYLKAETSKNKTEIIENNKNSYFSATYDSYKNEVKTDFNDEQWKKLELPTGENIVSNSLMDVFNTIKVEGN